MDNTLDAKKEQVMKMLNNEVSKYTKDGSSLPQAITLTCKKLGLNPYNIVSKYFPEIKPDDLNAYKDIKTDEGSFVTLKGDSSQSQYEVININNKDAIVLRNTDNNQEITASEDEITPVITENKMDKLNEAQYSVSINGLETTDAAALSQMLSSAAQAEQSNGAVTDPMSINPEPMDMTTGMPMDMGTELPAPSLDMPMDSTMPEETLPAEDSVEDVPAIEDDIEFDEELPADETISLDTDANAYANPEMDTAVVPTDSLEDDEDPTADEIGNDVAVNDESSEPVESPEELEPANDFGGEESIEDMSMDDMMDDGMYEGFDYDALIKEALEAAGLNESEETIPASEEVEDDGSMKGSQEDYAEEITEGKKECCPKCGKEECVCEEDESFDDEIAEALRLAGVQLDEATKKLIGGFGTTSPYTYGQSYDFNANKSDILKTLKNIANRAKDLKMTGDSSDKDKRYSFEFDENDEKIWDEQVEPLLKEAEKGSRNLISIYKNLSKIFKENMRNSFVWHSMIHYLGFHEQWKPNWVDEKDWGKLADSCAAAAVLAKGSELYSKNGQRMGVYLSKKDLIKKMQNDPKVYIPEEKEDANDKKIYNSLRYMLKTYSDANKDTIFDVYSNFVNKDIEYLEDVLYYGDDGEFDDEIAEALRLAGVELNEADEEKYRRVKKNVNKNFHIYDPAHDEADDGQDYDDDAIEMSVEYIANRDGLPLHVAARKYAKEYNISYEVVCKAIERDGSAPDNPPSWYYDIDHYKDVDAKYDKIDEEVGNDTVNAEINAGEIGGDESFDDEIAEALRLAGVELNEAEATEPTPVDDKTLYRNKQAKTAEKQEPEYHEVDTTPFSKESSEGFKMTMEAAVNKEKVKKIYETAKSMYAKKDFNEWMTLDRRYVTKLIKEGISYDKANKILTSAKKGK